MKEFYPIGTVVILSGGNKPLMIYGRLQYQADSEKIWDYVACLYPEGNISDDYNVFFHHDDIEKVLFIGFETEQDKEYQKLLIEKQQQLNSSKDKPS